MNRPRRQPVSLAFVLSLTEEEEEEEEENLMSSISAGHVFGRERKTTTKQRREGSAHAPSNVAHEHQVFNRRIIAMSNIN